MKEFKLEMEFVGVLQRPQYEVRVLVMPWNIAGMQSNDYYTFLDIFP